MKKLFFIVLIVVGFLALGIAGTLSIFKKDTIFNVDSTFLNKEEVFKVEGIKQLNVETEVGNIQFHTVKTNEIKVLIKGKIIETNKEAIPELHTQNANGELLIQIQRKSIAPTLYYQGEVQIDIEIPENYSENITLKTVSGNTHLNNLNVKKLSIQSVSGEVTLEQMTFKEVFIDTISGQALLKGCKGDTWIKTVSGNVSVDYSEFRNKSLIDTISGNVNIKLPANAEFNLNARTISGIIDCKFPIVPVLAERNNLEGSVGNGKNGTLQLSTTSGGISILK